MRHLRRGSFGPTPATTRPQSRAALGPQPRRPRPKFPVLLTAAGAAYSESVTETIVFTHRVRTNQAPLATGRYRR